MNFENLNAQLIWVFIGLLLRLCPICQTHAVFPNCLGLLRYHKLLLVTWCLYVIELPLSASSSSSVGFWESLSVCSGESLVAGTALEDLEICSLFHQYMPFALSSHSVETCSTFWAFTDSFELFSHVFIIGQLGTIC